MNTARVMSPTIAAHSALATAQAQPSTAPLPGLPSAQSPYEPLALCPAAQAWRAAHPHTKLSDDHIQEMFCTQVPHGGAS